MFTLFRILLLYAGIVLLYASSIFADGFIIPIPPEGIERVPQLAVQYHHVEIEIDNQVATVQIDQVFKNEFYRDIEGVYIFPLPEEASITEFSMYADGKKMTGEILDKHEARRIYEDMVRRMRDPALLEYVGKDMFHAKVYPIPSHGEKRVELKYTQLLQYDTGLVKFVYPLNTERFSARPIHEVTITIELDSPTPIKNIYSPSHPVNIIRKNDYHAAISYEAMDTRPDIDFVIYYSVSEDDIGMSVLTFCEPGKDGYFMVLATPKQHTTASEAVAKDIVFVLDTSGSMLGKKIEQAKNALKHCLHRLSSKDRFNLITFSSDVKSLHTNLLNVTDDRLEQAVNFVSGIKARGGTDINRALLDALELLSDTKRLKFVIFLTDGIPTVGETGLGNIIDNVQHANQSVGARIFVFGVGEDVNTYLLDNIAESANGVSQYVLINEDLELAVSNFYEKISEPVLSEVRLDYGKIKVYDIYPKRLPVLFKGSQLVVLGRYNTYSKETIKLHGYSNGKRYSYTIPCDFGNTSKIHSFLPRLWATRKVGYLLDEIRLHGENKELIDEIIMISKEYGIITPYTSFVVHPEIEERLLSSTYGTGEALEYFGLPTPEQSTGRGALKTSKDLHYLKEITADILTSAHPRAKTVGNRTFVFKDKVWVQTTFAEGTETIKIKYNSDAYFQLITKDYALGKILAIGEHIIFSIGKKWVEITDEGGKSFLTDIELDDIFGY